MTNNYFVSYNLHIHLSLTKNHFQSKTLQSKSDEMTTEYTLKLLFKVGNHGI